MNVKATFFIVGNQARRHPDVLARIAREGHLLASCGRRSPDGQPAEQDDAAT